MVLGNPQETFRTTLGQGIPRINWQNPITRGLFALYIPGATGRAIMPNLVGGGRPLAVASGTTWNLLSEGTAMVSTANSAGANDTSVPTTIMRPVDQASVFWRGTFSGSQAGINVPLMGIVYASPEADPYMVFGVVNGTDGGNTLNTYWNTGSVGSVAEGSAATALPTAGKISSVAGTFRIGDNARMYLDAVLKNTTAMAAGTGAFLYSATSRVNLGCYSPITTRQGQCSTLIGMMWNRQLSPAEVISISLNPYQFLIYPEDDALQLMLRNLYSVDVSAGAYALSGVAQNLKVGYMTPASAGSYALTGQTAILSSQRKVYPAAGSYAQTGNTATLAAGRKLVPATGTYSLTGQDAILLAARKLIPATGSYSVAGVNASLVAGRKVYPLAGSYTVSGQAAALLAAREVYPSAGAYALTGQDAALSASRKIIPAAGEYDITGNAATLAALRKIYPDAGIYALDGKNSSLRVGHVLIPLHGIYVIEGMDAILSEGHEIRPAPGSYGLTGYGVTFTLRRGKSKIIFITGVINDPEIEAVLRS